MSRVKILVVEDELIIADNICNTLSEFGYEVSEAAISYTEALEKLDSYNPDIAILDIQLSGSKDGVDLAWKIKEDYDIPFIFLTSSADKLTIDRVKKLSPNAYLVKPFNKDELYTSIEIALFNFVKHEPKDNGNFSLKDSLFIKQKNLFVKVKFDDILFIQSSHVYVEITTIDEQKYVVRDTLNNYINKLNNSFIRVHRGYIVNLSHLKTIDHGYVMINNSRIPISKNYREDILKKIKVL